MMRRRPAQRRGFSLLEVLLALAIFLIGLIALYELLGICTDQAMETARLNQANQLLQYTMNRVIAGDIPLNGQGETDFDGDANAGWVWSMQCDADSTPNLWHVTVTVTFKTGDDTGNSWTLSQMVLDPKARGTIEAPSSSRSSSSTNPTGMGQ